MEIQQVAAKWVTLTATVDKALRKRVYTAWLTKNDADFQFLHHFDSMVYEKGIKALDKELDLSPEVYHAPHTSTIGKKERKKE